MAGSKGLSSPDAGDPRGLWPLARSRQPRALSARCRYDRGVLADGELTQTQGVRRDYVLAKFAADVEALYS